MHLAPYALILFCAIVSQSSPSDFRGGYFQGDTAIALKSKDESSTQEEVLEALQIEEEDLTDSMRKKTKPVAIPTPRKVNESVDNLPEIGSSNYEDGKILESEQGVGKKTKNQKRKRRRSCQRSQEANVDNHRRVPRGATALKERIWDYGLIPYEISAIFGRSQKALFKKAMRHWENFTCIQFVKRNRDDDKHFNHIFFTEEFCGCCSHEGKQGNGRQSISIGKDCYEFGIVVHELGHVIGFAHEHQRPDRDKYVNILWDNIESSQKYNFEKKKKSEINSLRFEYDFDSIMHYPRNIFANKTAGDLDTIQAIDVPNRKRLEFGKSVRLSEGDIAQTNLLYNCPKCGRTYQDRRATFSSPTYVNRNAPKGGEKCEWRISASYCEKIILNITMMDIANSTGCTKDYLEIRDGYWHESPLLHKFCGKKEMYLIPSTGSKMLITYVSKNPHRHKGFTASYEVLANERITCKHVASTNEAKCGRVHLTVSPSPDSYLELNWITLCDHPDDRKPEYIALFNYNIKDGKNQRPPLARIRTNDYPEGHYKTKIKFGHPCLPNNWEYNETVTSADPGPHCFPYWIAAFKGNDLVDSACLGIQPTWMNDNKIQVENIQIGDLFIPGTHNSGSFEGMPRFLANYLLNQGRSVWTQLVHGIRYLDLTIGYYEHEGFFVNHDVARLTKLVPIFEEIKKFLELAPKEVIVLDFHSFPFPLNFNMSLHNKFISLVHEHLGQFALPPGELHIGKGPTLKEIWKQNKNLIICYADKEIVGEIHWLWQPLQQHWGNTNDVDFLKNFLYRAIRKPRMTSNPMIALMAELTPQPIDLIFRNNTLRVLADVANRKVTKWFRDEWSKYANIVATDFFLGNDLINVAIEANIPSKKIYVDTM